MKTIIHTALAAAVAVGSLIGGASAADRALVVYFSHSGNTRALAQQIHAQVGGDLVEIVPVKPYPADYGSCVDQAKKEKAAQARPAITVQGLDSLDAYSTIYLGYPNWWSTYPMPVATFLSQRDFSGKRVIPFCTHGGGGLGTSVSDLRAALPKARIGKPFACPGGSVRSASTASRVKEWLAAP